MADWLDNVKFNPTAGSTTDWTFSTAVSGYQSPSAGGVVNGNLYKYFAISADLSQWEIGEGAYNTGTGVLARTTVLYNSSATGTATGQSGAGTKINFSTVPIVAVVGLKEDLMACPASATDNALARFNGTTGKIVQNSEITLGDSDGKMTRTAGISVSGTNTNDSAAAGYVGEIIESEILTGSAVSVTTGTAADITSISLTAGDWDVWGLVCSVLAGGSSVTAVWGWINTVSATSPTAPGKGAFVRQPCAAIVDNFQVAVGARRISISGTTTVYLGGLVNFTIGTMKMFGYIGARRAR